MPRLDHLLRDASRQLDAADAAILLAHVLGRPRSWLYAHGDDDITEVVALEYAQLLARRLAGEPVAYLTGSRGFWGLDLRVTADTLVPRAETERLVELALERLPADCSLRIADLGTGSGAVALALASERPRASVLACDASAAALVVAHGNARTLQISNVEFRLGDWWSPLAGERFDLVASNPPYVALGDPHLDVGDLRFEPSLALSSGADGLAAIRTIVSQAPAYLLPGGWLLLEHGWDQGDAVRALLLQSGFDNVYTEADLEQRERVSLGQLPVHGHAYNGA